MNKEELSNKINEMLGLKENPIDFTKLSKDEMIRLYEAIESLTIGGGILGFKILKKPIGEIMNMKLVDLLKDIRDGKGILGLGLLKNLIEHKPEKEQK